MKLPALVLSSLVLCLGCQPGGDPPATPGISVPQGEFFRFVNATPNNLVLMFDNLRVQEPYTPADSPCSFRKGAPNKHKLVVSDEGGKELLSTSIQFESGAFITYVVSQDGNKVVLTPYDKESRAVPDSGARIRLIGPSVGKVSLSAKGGSATEVTPAEAPVPVGKYDVSVNGKPLLPVELEDRITYSLFAYLRDGQPKALLLRNSPEPMDRADQKVQQAGG